MRGGNINATTERVHVSAEDFSRARDVVNEYGGLALFGRRVDVIDWDEVDHWFDVKANAQDIALLDALLNGAETGLSAGPVPLTLEQRVNRIERSLGI